MLPRRRTVRKILIALLPIVLVVFLAFGGGMLWFIYGAAHPKRHPYLVTPEKFAQLSDRGLKATDETWSNRDGTRARGWVLRGAAGAPAVVLLHRYGADRSWLLNLGVKLSETTNFTVLWPDLRGHGENPPVEWTSFGTREAEDVSAAMDYLRSLKSPQGQPLVGRAIGLYGVELGAYAALVAASREASARALVLDSVPASPDELVRAVVQSRTSLDVDLLHQLARVTIRAYFLGDYQNMPACEAASSLTNRRVLLLSGDDAGYLRASTTALAPCFPNQSNIAVDTNLPLSGFNIVSATGQQGEAYDRRVIDFFDRALLDTP